MHQPNATRFAALHPFRHLERDQASGSDDAHYFTISGNLEPKQQTSDQVLRLFAAFILNQVGDDEVSFDFVVYDAGNIQNCGSIGVSRVASDLTLTTTRQESQSDFGIIVFENGSGNGSEYFAGKPFLVVVSESRYALHLSRDIVPEPFFQSLCTSFLSMMGWPENPSFLPYTNAQTSPFTGLSVINHPPLMTPPDFESQLGLTKSLSQNSSLLHTAFLARARENPEQTAVDFLHSSGRTQTTYRELERQSSILAEQILQKVGISANQDNKIIIVALNTSPQLYMAWLGILRARCVVAPVPIDCPPELLQHMMEVTGSKIVLGSIETLQRFQTALKICTGFTFIDVATVTDGRFDSGPPQLLPSIQISKDDIAYILFTSGSTGKPKGVQITHDAAICSVAAQIVVASHSFQSGPSNTRWFQMVAPAFDMSVTEIFATLSLGGTLCSCDRTMMLTDTESVINELNANVTLTTPSLASLLRPERVPSLRAVWTGGEMLRKEIATNFAFDGDRAIENGSTYSVNGYGPTETTIFCTMDPKVSVKTRVALIGPPLPTCSLVILDLVEAKTVMPMGFAGEIAMGGPHLSIGYLNDYQKTAAAFIELEPFGKLYRTGDKGRVIVGPDGTPQVEFLGRLSSDQIKISGKRVELGEIEDGLKNPLVAVAVVALKSGGADEKQVQLIAVVSPIGTHDDKEILDSCKERAQNVLQPHMRPTVYYMMDKLPRLPSDKTDRKTLMRLCASPESSGMRLISDEREESCELGDDTVSLSGIVVDAVSRVSVVSRDNITARTTLLSLGIDSLRSVRLLQIFRESGIDGLQVTDILTSRNLGDLSAKAERQLERPATSSEDLSAVESILKSFEQRHRAQCVESLGYEDKSVESVLPATTSQAVTLASYLLTADADGASVIPGLKAYIQHTVFYVKPELCAQDVVDAWVRVLSRYDVMRTVFVPIDDDLSPFAQCILSPEHDAAIVKPHLYYTDEEEEVQNFIVTAQDAANKAITLQEPPRRLSVIQTPKTTIVVFSILHSIFDGGSEAVLWEDVERECLNQSIMKRTGISTAVARHFSQDRDLAYKYWASYMEGLTSPPFPCLRSTIPGRTELGCGGFSFVSELFLNTVTSKAAALQVSPLSVFQAAWAYVLLTYSGARDVAFGNVVSDRFTDDLANCSAPVLTVHPIRVFMDDYGKKKNIDVFLEATKQNAAAFSHLHTPITGARYDTTLALQMYLNTGKGASLYDKVEHPGMQNDQAVMIEVYPHASGVLEFRVTYQYALLDDVTACSILRDLARVTENMLSNPEAFFLDPAIGNPQPTIDARPQAGDLGRQLLHECVVDKAHTSPSSIALAFYDDLAASTPKVRLTYAELNAMSDIVSSFLLNVLGKGSKYVVPICMEKCPELYIAILGVLKAGASWCPIDPSYPAVRQRLLIEKTNTKTVLASETTLSQLSGILQAPFEAVNVANLLTQRKQLNEHPSELGVLQPLNATSISDSDIAYIIFTSGTTGTPKGVPISHKAASVSIDSFIERISTGIDVTGDDVQYLQFAQFTFDVFVRDVFAAWKLGGTLVSASRDILLGSFTTLANQVNATHASMTPTFASTLEPEDLTTLRVVTMGGEKLPQSIADRWLARVSLCNVYGPAETAINATINNLMPKSRSGNIGMALPAVHACVMVSEYPVMRHGLGELIISGVQLSPGYWDSEADNDEKFRWNEFLKRRVYHTGDYVRQLFDGSFDFVGRKDDLVKIRGMRVEMGEISTVCSAAHESVAHAEVILTQIPGSTDDVLVCFIDCRQQVSSQNNNSYILETDAAESIAHLVKSHARAQLPQHMVPDIFIPLRTIPRNQSAKVNRKELLMILATEWSADPTSQTDAEEVDLEWYNQHQPILDTIRSVAKILPSTLSKTTTLAEIGVDSIGAIRLSSKLKNIGHTISTVQVLDSATIDDLISNLSIKNQSNLDWKLSFNTQLEIWRPLVANYLGKDPNQFYTLPTTTFQDGILVETLKSPTLYWASFAWDLLPDADIGKIRTAYDRVCKANDILRLTLLPTALLEQQDEVARHESSAMFLQVVHNEVAINWEESNAESGDLQLSIKTIRDKFAAAQHANTFSSPLWQVNILSHQDRKVMVLTIHHSLYDGDMMGHLMNDVAATYTSDQTLGDRCQVSEALSRLTLRTNKPTAEKVWHDCLSPFAQLEDLEDTKSSTVEASPKEIRHRTMEMKATHRTSKLAALARQLGAASLGPLFRVAFGSMLAEYRESESVLFGEVRSERLLNSRLVDAMAPLSATYPVPFKSGGSLKQLILKQQSLVMEGTRHGPPESAQVRKILGRGQKDALYPAIFVLHPHNQNGQGSSAPWQEIKDVLDPVVDHEFALNIFENGDDTVTLSLSVDETVITSDLQKLFLQQLDALVVAFEEAGPQTSLSQLTEQLPTNLLSICSSNVVAQYPPIVGPVSYVETWAKQHPDWKAVEVVTEFLDDGGILTDFWSYEKFNETANQVANLIISFGIPGRAVGVCLDRSLIAFAVIIGILKAGCTYVPIEMSLPVDRKSFLLKDSSAALAFVCDDAFAQVELPADALLFDVKDTSFLADLTTRDTANIPDNHPADRDAYLLYTSGSTGAPKGVRVSRQNLSSFNSAWGEFVGDVCPISLELGGVGKFLNLASRAFDVHIGEMFLAWRFGMCAVTGERLSMLDDIPRTLKELKVTHVGMVPSLLDQTGLLPEDVPDLAYLGVGGEKMTPKTQQIWASSPSISLVNAYGPTEVTVGCTAALILPESDTRRIGCPLGDSIAHVLVPGADTLVKKGMAGELVFEGSLVANGYLNRPDAKGFCEINGKRMYRTGDIVRMDADNSILFLGRKDEQVKVRGQRLELGEVSEVVRSLSRVESDVVTLLLKHPGTSKQFLVSFLAPRGAAQSEKLQWVRDNQQDTLQDACSQTLPAYMVPDFIIPVTMIPLRDTSAKTDAKALDRLFRSIPLSELFGETSTEVGSQDQLPSRKLTQAEEDMMSVIEGVVPSDRGRSVGPATTLFQLGFDSVSAVRLSFTFRRLGYNLPVARLLQNPTVEELCRMTHEAKSAQGDVPIDLNSINEHFEDLERRARKLLQIQGMLHVKSIRPCMPLQEILVAHTMTHGVEDENAYVSHMVFELSPSVSIESVKAAWIPVIRNNELLRTCFSRLGDDIVQLVLEVEHAEPRWQFISGSQEERQAQLISTKRDLANDIVANIGTLPPLRFTSGTFTGSGSADKASLFMLSIHHSLYDGASIKLIFEDFEAAYRGHELTQRPSVLPLLKHIAAQQQNHGDTRKYWVDMFSEYNPITKTAAPKVRTTATKTLTASLSSLEGLCSQINSTLSAVNQGVFGYILSQKLKRHDLTYGVVLSGRSVEIDGIESMAAPCISTIPQRLRLGADGKSLSELIKAAQDRLYTSMAYQYTSLRSLQRWLGISGSLFTNLFSFTRTGPSEDTIHKEPRILQQVEGEMFLDFELALECEADSTTNTVTLRANSTMFDTAEELTTFLDEMQSIMSDLLHGQDKQIKVLENGLKTILEPQPEDDQLSPIEEQLRDIVAEFSDCISTEIGKTVPLIKYDIDSITTIRFVKMLRQNGFQVSGADVLRNPSIARLAAHIELQRDSRDTPSGLDSHGSAGKYVDIPTETCWSKDMISGSTEDILSNDIVAVYPLTALQAGMVTATVMMDPSLYSHHHVVELPEGIDNAKLKAAWCSLVAQHDILRTSFHETKGPRAQLVGAVHQKPALNWSEVEVAGSVQAAIDNLTERTRFASIASFESPPVSATVIRSLEHAVLVVSLHHATYDGVSIGFLFNDLWALIHGSKIPERKPFYELAREIQAAGTKSTSFWVDSLAGYHGVLDSEPSENSITARTVELTQNVSLLQQWCAEQGVTVQTVCQLAVGKAIAAHSKSRDVVLGQVHAARLVLPGADEVVGPVLNTVPLRICLKEASFTNSQCLRELQALQNDALEHLHASLSDIQRLWKQVHAHNEQLFGTLFVFRRGEDSEEPKWPASPEHGQERKKALPPSQYNLVVEVHQNSDDTLQLQVYSKFSEQITDEVVRLLVESFQSVQKRPEECAIACPELLAELAIPRLEMTNKMALPHAYDSDAVDCYLNSLITILSKTTDNSPEKMDTHTSIFSLGVDSIVAIRVASACRRAQIPLTTMDILRNAKLGKLCEVAFAKATKQTAPRDAPDGSKVAASSVDPQLKQQALVKLGKSPEDVEDILPVLAGQEFHLALWLLSGKTQYEPTWVFKTTSELQVDRLRSAWVSLVQRHESLRTCFARVNRTVAVQVILKPNPAQAAESFAVLDVPESSDLETFVKSEISKLYRRPSSLYDPPVHLCLVRGGARGDVVLLRMHHTIYDAWTVGILIDDLTRLYRDDVQEAQPAALTFSKFVEATLNDIRANNEHEFWKEALQDCEPTVLKPRIAIKEDAPRQKRPFVVYDCSETSKASIEAAARAYGVTVQCLIVVAFGRMLADITDVHSSPVFGYYTAGRSSEMDGVDRLASPTVNMLPIAVPKEAIQVHKSENMSAMREVLQGMQEKMLARSRYEQSRLRDVMSWAATVTTTDQATSASSRLFNTHLNILWNDEIMLKPFGAAQVDAILQPWPLGVPSDYASVEALMAQSSVDGLDTSVFTIEAVYADVGVSPETGNVAVGIGGHASLRDVDGLRDMAHLFAKYLADIIVSSRRG